MLLENCYLRVIVDIIDFEIRQGRFTLLFLKEGGFYFNVPLKYKSTLTSHLKSMVYLSLYNYAFIFKT